MSWSSLANNQTISYNNLQDAVNNGVFTLVSAISASTRLGTKSYVAAHVSGFSTTYPPYANKSSNQLLVKGDIYNLGNFILDAQYGMYFTSMSGSVGGLPTFSYPVTGGNTTQTYNGTIASQTITVGLDGSLVTSPASIVLYVDGVQVDCLSITSGSQSKTLNLSVAVNSPSTIKIAINSGSCSSTPTTPIFTGKSFNAVAVNRGSGQYMIAGATGIYGATTAGYLYYSSNYGSTWTQSSLYSYFTSISMSDNGQYVIAITLGNNYNYLSSDYGATFTAITSLPPYGGYNSALSNDGQYQIIVSYAGTTNDVKLYGSSNYGSTWTNLNGNLGGVIPNQCAMSATAGVYLITGFDNSGGYIRKSTNNGSSWSTVYYNTNSAECPNRIAINASNGGAICQAGPQFGANGFMLKSSDSGSSWSKITSGNSSQTFNKVSINTSNSNTGYITIYDSATNKYIQSASSGLSSIGNLTSSGSRKWYSVANSDNGNYILAGADSGLYLSTNSGSSFSAL